jgi:hypothetical protein
MPDLLQIALEPSSVRRVTEEERQGVTFERNGCHRNVARWLEMPGHEHHRPCRGYIITSGFLADKHSVVETETELLEATPFDNGYMPVFHRFMGSEDEFWKAPIQTIVIF